MTHQARHPARILTAALAAILLASACGGAAAQTIAPTAAAVATLPPLSTTTAATLPPQSATPAATPTLAATPTSNASPTSSASPSGSSQSLVAAGKVVFTTINGTGCQACHGADGKGGIGTDGVTQAPNILGATEQKLRDALRGGAALMTNIKLTDDQITAVLAYLEFLDQQ